MIHLQIEEYCHECPEFTPLKDTTYRRDPGGRTIAVDNPIYCGNFVKCMNIAKYLKQKLSEEKKNDQG